jgi:SanA protein
MPEQPKADQDHAPSPPAGTDAVPNANGDTNRDASRNANRIVGASAPANPMPPQALPGAPSRLRRPKRKALLALLSAAVLAIAGMLGIDLMVSISAGQAVTEDITQIEPTPVALLLGTARTHQGRPNQFYRARIEAAAELFQSGRVRGILVSGDNATRYYNEPVSMQKDLIALGVPPEFITLDYAGFRTLDSVVRAKQVFGVDRIVVVSQRFHAERAIFLARHFGIEANGLAAADPESQGLMKVRAREVLARVVAVLDIVIGREPKFLGAPETVRLRDDTQQSNSA